MATTLSIGTVLMYRVGPKVDLVRTPLYTVFSVKYWDVWAKEKEKEFFDNMTNFNTLQLRKFESIVDK